MTTRLFSAKILLAACLGASTPILMAQEATDSAATPMPAMSTEAEQAQSQEEKAEENLLARAAYAGNVEEVALLQARFPRYYEAADLYDSSKGVTRHDAWSEAAVLALQSPYEAQRAQLFKMLVRADTDWNAPISRDMRGRYLAGLQDTGGMFNGTLLSHTVAAGDIELLRQAIALGALRGGTPNGDALAVALNMHRLDLVETLVAAGASPVALTSAKQVPLALAINGNPYFPEEGRYLNSTEEGKKFRNASVEMLMRALTPEQVRAIDTPELTPMKAAIETNDPALIGMLTKTGFSLKYLQIKDLANVLDAENIDLANAMLDAGVGSAVSDKEDASEHNQSLVDAIGCAALLGNAAILDRLLALPHDDAALNRYKQQELAQLATYGRTDALELLRQRDWEMDDAMRLQAVNSMRPDAISYVLKTSGSAIEDFCITPSRYDDGSPLSNAIQYYPEKRWQQLISLGIARLQGCARAKDDDERDDPANGNPMNQIAIALILDPFSMSDQHKRYVPERIKQLREAGMNAADFSTPTMRGFAAAGFSSEPALQPLLSALGVSAPKHPVSKGKPSHPSTLVGVYYGGRGEVGTGLTLRADGRFQWFMSYGAIDKQATGRWEVIGRQVIFTTDVQPPHTWFKIADTSQYADGAATGQPLTIKIAGVSNRLIPFFEGRIYDDTGKFGRLHMDDQFETEVKLEGQPRTIALWFEQMETRVAAEVAVPDIPRLKSVTITVTPPSEPPSAPFDEVAEISDGGLLIGGTLYRK